jgi:polysaccharide export outer membrane protein
VEVAEYRPFFIQGEINNAGQFPYLYGMSARAAISTAGGFKETADQSQVLVYRRNGNEMVKAKVDLDFPIYPGDTIVVLERWF